jgi:guanylate kinase
MSSCSKLIIITAPSGSGKSTIVQHLLSHFPQLCFSISACTRKPRLGERDGVNYYFISIEDFTRKISQHEFAEFEMVYEGKYYGTLKAELERIWNHQQTPLIDIDVQGAIRLKKHYGQQALTLFIQAPNLEILEQRLRNRQTETEESLQERLYKASDELTYANQFDALVVNDDLQTACNQTISIITKFLEVNPSTPN